MSMMPLVPRVKSSKVSLVCVGLKPVSQRTASCEPRFGVPSISNRLPGSAVMRRQASAPGPAAISRATSPPIEWATMCTG
jgi:hypothetical protein